MISLVLITIIGTATPLTLQSTYAMTKPITDQRNAPISTSGDNVYVA